MAGNTGTLAYTPINGGPTFATSSTAFTVGGLSGKGSVSLTDNGTLAFNNNAAPSTYAGVITGAGGLTGTITLNGANTYTGGTTLSGGTLQLGKDEILAARDARRPGFVDSVSIDKSHVAVPDDAKKQEKTPPKPPETWKPAQVVPNSSRLMVGDKEELPIKGHAGRCPRGRFSGTRADRSVLLQRPAATA